MVGRTVFSGCPVFNDRVARCSSSVGHAIAFMQMVLILVSDANLPCARFGCCPMGGLSADAHDIVTIKRRSSGDFQDEMGTVFHGGQEQCHALHLCKRLFRTCVVWFFFSYRKLPATL